MESVGNSSTTPLPANGIFLGVWQDVSLYSSAVITIRASTDCEIVVYNSQTKQQTNATTFSSVANTQSSFVISPLINKYLYITCRNITVNQQTQLSLITLLKNASYSVVQTETGSKAVFPISGVSPLWFGQTGINGVSIPANINFESKAFTVYGNVNGATTITLQLSADGATYYDTQYKLVLTGASDFGYNLPSPCAIKYLRFKSSANVNCVLYINYC